MLDIESHFAAIRQKIDHLKAILQTTTDDAQRYDLHERLDECIRESMGLMDRQLQSYAAERGGGRAAPREAGQPKHTAGEHAGWAGEQRYNSDAGGQ
jgi:predicted  nucleic acid-binding Zn-ribbon protein